MRESIREPGVVERVGESRREGEREHRECEREHKRARGSRKEWERAG